MSGYVLDHLALTAGLALLADAPPGAIEVPGLIRSSQLDAVRHTFPELDWPEVHAVVLAISTGTPVLTTDIGTYTGLPVDVLAL